MMHPGVLGLSSRPRARVGLGPLLWERPAGPPFGDLSRTVRETPSSQEWPCTDRTPRNEPRRRAFAPAVRFEPVVRFALDRFRASPHRNGPQEYIFRDALSRPCRASSRRRDSRARVGPIGCPASFRRKPSDSARVDRSTIGETRRRFGECPAWRARALAGAIRVFAIATPVCWLGSRAPRPGISGQLHGRGGRLRGRGTSPRRADVGRRRRTERRAPRGRSPW